MRNYSYEFDARVDFIRSLLAKSGAAGIVYGNSGGKDSALVGILCKAACENTLGIIMPCGSNRNYGQDLEDGLTVAKQYQIETRTLDLTPLKNATVQQLAGVTELAPSALTNLAPRLRMAALYTVAASENRLVAGTGNRSETVQQLAGVTELAPSALTNLAPRLRMAALYTVAASENRLVAGTGNRSETYVGYFTKWGDGAHDFNPISDLTVTEIYEFLRWLNAPPCVIEKKPSAGLFDGQTDEQELGITYRDLDAYLLGGTVSNTIKQKIQQLHEKSEHKRKGIIVYEKSLDISRIDNLKGEHIQWI